MAAEGGDLSSFLFDLAAVYELAGHALTTVQEMTGFLFHQAESLRLLGSNPPDDAVAIIPLLQAYTNGSKTYLTNVIEGGASKRRKSHGVLGT